MSIIGNAKVCKDKIQKKDSTTKKCSSFQEKDCCSNQSVLKKGDDTIIKDNNELQTEIIVFLNSFFYTYINLFEGLDKNVVPFKLYKPLLLSKDIQILNETFLI